MRLSKEGAPERDSLYKLKICEVQVWGKCRLLQTEIRPRLKQALQAIIQQSQWCSLKQTLQSKWCSLKQTLQSKWCSLKHTLNRSGGYSSTLYSRTGVH